MAEKNQKTLRAEARARKKEQRANSVIDVNAIFGNMATKIEEMTPAEYSKKVSLYSLIAGVLIVASSVLYFFDIQKNWLPGFIGAPAGILLFWLGYSMTFRTRIGEWGIWDKREESSFKQRLATAGWVTAIYLILIFALFPHIPFAYGVAGATFVALVITGVCFLRKTPYELELDKEGLPDPRDLIEEDLEEYEVEAETKVDKYIGGEI